MAAAIIALPNTVTNDVVVATSDAELRISDRGLGLGLEVVGGGAAEVKLETRPGWRFRDGSTSVTLNKAAGKSAKSPAIEGEGKGAEGYVPGVNVNDDGGGDKDGDDEGSVDHVKPILSLTATAPKVVAYSVQDGGTNVSISLSATVTTNGKHRKLDAEGNVVEEKEFSPKHYVWKMTGVATGEAETDSSTHTFTVNLTKGESKWLNFSVVGKTCSICDGEVESNAATDSVEIDVYKIWFITPSGDPASEPHSSGVGKNEFTYEDKSEADGGLPIACINLNVGIDPAISGDRDYKGKFEISEIEGVALEWDDEGDGLVGAQDDIEDSRNHFAARPKYKNYPPHNSGFGRKTARFTFAGTTIGNDYEVFFQKGGNNHPACTTCPGCPNWFYYWREGDVCSIPKDAVWSKAEGGHERDLGWYNNGIIHLTDLASEEDHSDSKTLTATFAISTYEFEVVGKPAGYPDVTEKSKGEKGYAYSVELKEIISDLEEHEVNVIGGDGRGIGCAAQTVAHELKHRAFELANEEMLRRIKAIDATFHEIEKEFGIDSWEYASATAKHNSLMRHWIDGDRDDVMDGEESIGNGGIFSDVMNPDTYNFAQYFSAQSGYDKYGDQEIRARAAEPGAEYHVELDWANPGCQYSNKPFGPKK